MDGTHGTYVSASGYASGGFQLATANCQLLTANPSQFVSNRGEIGVLAGDVAETFV